MRTQMRSQADQARGCNPVVIVHNEETGALLNNPEVLVARSTSEENYTLPTREYMLVHSAAEEAHQRAAQGAISMVMDQLHAERVKIAQEEDNELLEVIWDAKMKKTESSSKRT